MWWWPRATTRIRRCRKGNDIHAVATAVGSTPDYTLAMLSGRYVVVDHGIIDGAGHVVSLYATWTPSIPASGGHARRRRPAPRRHRQHRHPCRRPRGLLRAAAPPLELLRRRPVPGRRSVRIRDQRRVAELFKYATGTEPRPAGTVDAGTGLHAGRPAASRPARGRPGRERSHPRATGRWTNRSHSIRPSRRQPGCPATWSCPATAGLCPCRAVGASQRAPRLPLGTHQGVDFGCPRLGQPAVAALAGRVVMAAGDFEDPSPQARSRLLDTASALGATPAYTLVMLYGNYVAVDHGIIGGVGHVMSLYAHLDELDAGIRPGLWGRGRPESRHDRQQRHLRGRLGVAGSTAPALGAAHRRPLTWASACPTPTPEPSTQPSSPAPTELRSEATRGPWAWRSMETLH